MGIMPLTIPADVRHAMLADCDARRPEEACGLIFGTVARDSATAVRIVPVDNVWPDAAERLHRFSIDPLAQMQAEAQYAKDGLDLIGFYHSHPTAAAVPSSFDLDRAWPAYYYVIVGYPDLNSRECRAWRLDEGGAFVEHAVNP